MKVSPKVDFLHRQKLQLLRIQRKKVEEGIQKLDLKLKNQEELVRKLTERKAALQSLDQQINSLSKNSTQEAWLQPGRLLGVARYMKESFTLNNKAKDKNRQLKSTKVFHVPHQKKAKKQAPKKERGLREIKNPIEKIADQFLDTLKNTMQ